MQRSSRDIDEFVRVAGSTAQFSSMLPSGLKAPRYAEDANVYLHRPCEGGQKRLIIVLPQTGGDYFPLRAEENVMKTKLLGLLAFMSLLGFSPASADTIYTYTGNDFTNASGSYTTTDHAYLVLTCNH